VESSAETEKLLPAEGTPDGQKRGKQRLGPPTTQTAKGNQKDETFHAEGDRRLGLRGSISLSWKDVELPGGERKSNFLG